MIPQIVVQLSEDHIPQRKRDNTAGRGEDRQYGVLTRTRHDHQPPQVLPLDEANSLALIRLRYAGAGYSGYGWIHDRGEFG
jgi:hypothetical protein